MYVAVVGACFSRFMDEFYVIVKIDVLGRYVCPSWSQSESEWQ